MTAQHRKGDMPARKLIRENGKNNQKTKSKERKSEMAERMFMRAEEVAEVLDVSMPYAYKLIRRMNRELQEKGCLVIAGRVDRRYFYDSFYGKRDAAEGGKEAANAGI